MTVIGDVVIEAARELLVARNYSSVVAVATGALEEHPEDIAMRLLRARALLALRRDEEAQVDLRECLRRQIRCAEAYRLLGELCMRRDEFESSAVFLREAIRLRPGDQHSRDLLTVVQAFIKPTAAVEKLPAATAAVGPFGETEQRPRRMAQGTCAPEDDDLFAQTEVDIWPVPAESVEVMAEVTDTESADSVTFADPPDPYVPVGLIGAEEPGPPTVPERPRATRRTPLGTSFDGSAEGFGGYLLRIGALNASELGRARCYQQRTRISLGEAIVALGFASEPTVITARLAYQAEGGASPRRR